MRRVSRWVCVALFILGTLAYLQIGNHYLNQISLWKNYITCSIENEQSEEKEEWGISPKEARSYLEKEEEKETPLSLVFWREKKSQTITNEEFFRKGTFSVLEICGNSALLFPGEFPLNKEDVEGCLIGEETAYQLFGDTNIVGKPLVYEEKTYYVRGVLSGENIFVCQTAEKKEVLLDQLTFYAESYLKKEEIKEQLQNQYGLSVKESPVYWKYIFIRAALFAFPACLLTVCLFLCRKKKALWKWLLFVEIIFLFVGIVFIFDITPEKLPNRLSDFDYWVDVIEKGVEDLKEFFTFL